MSRGRALSTECQRAVPRRTVMTLRSSGVQVQLAVSSYQSRGEAVGSFDHRGQVGVHPSMCFFA